MFWGSDGGLRTAVVNIGNKDLPGRNQNAVLFLALEVLVPIDRPVVPAKRLVELHTTARQVLGLVLPKEAQDAPARITLDAHALPNVGLSHTAHRNAVIDFGFSVVRVFVDLGHLLHRSGG